LSFFSPRGFPFLPPFKKAKPEAHTFFIRSPPEGFPPPFSPLEQFPPVGVGNTVITAQLFTLFNPVRVPALPDIAPPSPHSPPFLCYKTIEQTDFQSHFSLFPSQAHRIFFPPSPTRRVHSLFHPPTHPLFSSWAFPHRICFAPFPTAGSLSFLGSKCSALPPPPQCRHTFLFCKGSQRECALSFKSIFPYYFLREMESVLLTSIYSETEPLPLFSFW